MKRKKFSRGQNRKSADTSRPTAVGELNRNKIDFSFSPDEVDRKAYFSYVNQGSPPGHDVQHWLEAEVQFSVERTPTCIHGFHNQM